MAITKEQIKQVAEQLFNDGKNPTLAAVRNVLGGGSFTTISEAMQEWRDARQAPAAPIRELAPQAIIERVNTLSTDIWSIALEHANSRLRSEREALEADREEMDRQKAEAAELADEMAGEIDTYKAIVDTHLQTINNQILEMDRQENEINELKQRIAAIESENHGLKASLEFEEKQIEAHLGYLEQERQRNASLQEESKNTSIQNGVLNEQLVRLAADLEKEKKLHVQSANELKNATLKNKELETETKIVNDRFKTVEAKLEKAQNEIKEMLERKAQRKSIQPKKNEGEV